MKKRRKKPEERKEDIRTVKKNWNHRIVVFSGFSLLLFYLINLSLQGTIINIPFSQEIFLALVTSLTISFLLERWLRLKNATIYEIFYSSYLVLSLGVLTVLYWVSYLNGISAGIFRNLILLIHVIVFLYSLLTIKYSDKIWFIMTSYAFIAFSTIIIFAFIYWILSLLNLGHLQYSECRILDAELRSTNWFYFSSVTFYTLGYGDICPILFPTRFISQLESALGVLINTILIGFLFWKLKEDTIKKIEKKID